MKPPIQMYGVRVTYEGGATEEGHFSLNLNLALGNLYTMKGNAEEQMKDPPKITLIKGVFQETT